MRLAASCGILGPEGFNNGREVSHLAPFLCLPFIQTNKTQEAKTMTQPAHKIKIGRIAATIWNNDGFYSVDVSRAYKDNYDAWKSTNSFSQVDLLNLAKCAERAEAWINHKSNSTT